ncbi:hypothetical protein RHD99_20240 [Buttiauxella selenatireducens]|uniref:Uncharacterized protein n=1 Tax=Buttiauxella selenatireducens TaxID=3073902 RepID=A0ABY9S8A4_9ENTR|nr:hypothetical protein [Buttiauxella sp. R73]WMY73743.1 hypothetical protein RHD99_20240 [Buttiauxella sp. R73]
MLSIKSVNELIDKIVSLHLSKGVQPHELAEAAFAPNYDEIIIKKIVEGLKVYVSFFEDEDGQRTNHTMLYTYNSKKILQRVEQKVNNGKFKIQWDRSENLSHLINELSFKLSNNYTLDFINKLMSTLPSDLRKQYIDKSISFIK